MRGKDFKAVIDNSFFPVVPLVNYSKLTFVKWGQQDNLIKIPGELEAIGSTYKKEIDGKVKGGNLTGLALLCGKKSNIIVLDLDIQHDDIGTDGIKAFEEFIKDLPQEDRNIIFNTFSVQSPRGGIHLYFKYKEGLKNRANYLPGVDIRTDGGLAIMPGSKVKVGEETREYKIMGDGDIVRDMPISLFEKLIALDKPKTEAKKIDSAAALSNSKYYKVISEGGRDSALTSWLGFMIKNNPSLRTKEALTPQAITYNRSWFNPPLSDELVAQKVESVLKYAFPSYCDEKGNIDNWNLVQEIIKNQPSYTKGNLWYLYDTEKGFYNHLELKEVQKMFFQYAINNKDKTVIKSKNFAELLMLNSIDARKVHDEKNYINCLNGVIDIEKDILLAHDPKYKLEIQFQANYILDDWREKFNNSEFKKFLDTTLDSGSILTLQEACGLYLSPHASEVQNCFIFKGEGSNGKTLAFDILEALISDNKYICNIGLGDFGEPFVISMAEGKHANLVRDDELSGKTIHKFFKSMVCGEPVLVNRKNKDLVRLGFNMCHFFGLNRLPSAADKSTGFFRRPIIIPFNVSFGTEKEVEKGIYDKVKDTGLANRIIKNEMDIVFMWAYEGLKRVKANKWKINVSEAAEQEMEEYREEVDSAYSFYRARIIQSQGNKIPKDKVYNSYLNWCSLSDITPMNKIQFGRQFKSFRVKDSASNSVRYWLNIELDLVQIDEGNNPFL